MLQEVLQVKNKKVEYRQLGLIDFKEAWDFQTRHFNEIIDLKIRNRDASIVKPTPNFLFTCQHPHVYTLGKSGKKDNLLINGELLSQKKASYYEINRGGDITYHGPGQLVVYPVLDLDNFFTDIHKYMRYLEEAVIRTIKRYGVEGGRINGLTGVWIEYENPHKARKICACGVKTSRWVSMHGIGFNVCTDLSYFENIIPCGISDKAVTSLEKELGASIEIAEVEKILVNELADLFEMDLV